LIILKFETAVALRLKIAAKLESNKPSAQIAYQGQWCDICSAKLIKMNQTKKPTNNN